MTLVELTALAGAMALGASLPSVSTFAVAARSAACGLAHGALTTAGIVCGDLLFIFVAVYGLHLVVQALDGQAALIKYVGGAYLILLGVSLWRTKSKEGEIDEARHGPKASSFATGLLITLGDQKAILFYLAFLPGFVDLSAIALADTAAILAVATVAVGAPKLAYAFAAHRAGKLLRRSAAGALHAVAGSAFILVGVLLIAAAATASPS